MDSMPCFVGFFIIGPNNQWNEYKFGIGRLNFLFTFLQDANTLYITMMTSKWKQLHMRTRVPEAGIKGRDK